MAFDIGNRFKVGDRVEMHPATDEWMRGDRFGEIVFRIRGSRQGMPGYRVKLDKSGRFIRTTAELIGHISDAAI